MTNWLLTNLTLTLEYQATTWSRDQDCRWLEGIYYCWPDTRPGPAPILHQCTMHNSIHGNITYSSIYGFHYSIYLLTPIFRTCGLSDTMKGTETLWVYTNHQASGAVLYIKIRICFEDCSKIRFELRIHQHSGISWRFCLLCHGHRRIRNIHFFLFEVLLCVLLCQYTKLCNRQMYYSEMISYWS